MEFLRRRIFDRLQGDIFDRVRDAFRALRENPRPPGYLKLENDDAYRVRIGDYRAIYDIDDSAQTVVVLRVEHRRDAYRHP